jgi:hypothetical protein
MLNNKNKALLIVCYIDSLLFLHCQISIYEIFIDKKKIAIKELVPEIAGQ